MHEDVKLLFQNKPEKIRFSLNETIEKGHGRIEKRVCTVTDDIDWLRAEHSHWKDLRSIIEIESVRDIKGEVSIEKRYYISSHNAQPDVVSNAIRQHWGVENKLHWVLDICFGDDQSRIRKGNAPRNMAIIKKRLSICFKLLKKSGLGLA